MKFKNVFIAAFLLASLPEFYGCQTIGDKNAYEITYETETSESNGADVQKFETVAENNEDEKVVFFYQKDAKWKSDALGDSKYKMDDSGCLTCCVASVLSMSGFSSDALPENYDAGDVNKYFSENNVYDSEGNMQWDQLENLTGFTVEKTEENEITGSTLDDYLNAGYYPVIRVRVNGYGNYHYVLVVGKRDGEYHCMDPLKNDNKTTVLSEYKNKIYAVRCLVK